MANRSHTSSAKVAKAAAAAQRAERRAAELRKKANKLAAASVDTARTTDVSIDRQTAGANGPSAAAATNPLYQGSEPTGTNGPTPPPAVATAAAPNPDKLVWFAPNPLAYKLKLLSGAQERTVGTAHTTDRAVWLAQYGGKEIGTGSCLEARQAVESKALEEARRAYPGIAVENPAA